MATFKDRLKNSWNAFLGRDPTESVTYYTDIGPGYSYRPDRTILTRGNERSIITTIYNRIATDVAMVDIRHVRLNKNKQYSEDMESNLNKALTLSANLDQTGRSMTKDLVLSMFDEGCVAVVPTLTTSDPRRSESYDIYELRVGKIIEWYPSHVKVKIYREDTGRKEEIVLPKKMVAIIENPFYAIMNEPNSAFQRLRRILNQVDKTNDQNSAGKMDLIIQLPYITKSPTKQLQAEERRKKIEAQLTGSQYGIAYIDGTEKITQLNRSVENNLWQQAKDVKEEIYSQLGLSETILNGTADEKTNLNYQNTAIAPILTAIVEEYQRKFLSDTAITQGQAIRYFREPFKLVPVDNLAEIADKFTRNEIMTKNEFRSILGMKPSDDPKADQLLNSNINHPDEEIQKPEDGMPDEGNEEENINEPETEGNTLDEQALLDEIKKLGG
jgi:hypothetical protein